MSIPQPVEDFPGHGLRIYTEDKNHPVFIRTTNFLRSINVKYSVGKWSDLAMFALYTGWDGTVDDFQAEDAVPNFGSVNTLVVGYTTRGEWVELVNDAKDLTLVALGELFSE